MVCGTKCMVFMLFMCIWGIVFLSILGGLYWNESVGLFENLPAEDSSIALESWEERKKHIKSLYRQNAYNSWVAAGGYVALGVLCGVRLLCLQR